MYFFEHSNKLLIKSTITQLIGNLKVGDIVHPGHLPFVVGIKPHNRVIPIIKHNCIRYIQNQLIPMQPITRPQRQELIEIQKWQQGLGTVLVFLRLSLGSLCTWFA